MQRALCLGCLLTAAAARSALELVKGICYGPMPCRDTACTIKQDDFMDEASKPMWGPRGRADLQVIRQLGANTVRLYGNNPADDHAGFLDEAHKQGLSVVVGISDYPYTQLSPGACRTTGWDCYEQIKASYLQNLQTGFLLENQTYHPALREVIAINEPDLKAPGISEPRLFAKAVASAIDGMLDAEQEANVTGDLINFTATFSFGICSRCLNYTTLPALGQMAQLRDAMMNPRAYGYVPRNDLAEAYRTRFINSFNTNNPARDIRPMFLDYYEVAFPDVPVMIEEYHAPHWNVSDDLPDVLELARSSNLLQGISFFEYQVRYDKGGSETAFGIFGLGDYAISDFDYKGGAFDAWCLVPVKKSGVVGGSMPAAVATAYGGPGPDYALLCVADPAKVRLDPAGFVQIAAQLSAARMATFVARVVEHLGGSVLDVGGLDTFAARYATASAAGDFGAMVTELTGAPAESSWVSWDPSAACVADRRSNTAAVGLSVAHACAAMSSFSCASVPAECAGGGVWTLADFVFGVYYREHGSENPLENCYFGGSAIFASSAVYEANEHPACVVDANTTIPAAPAAPGRGFLSPSSPSAVNGGGCRFPNEPTTPYYWEAACGNSTFLGCNADGKHMQCRWCGFGPFSPCPA